MYTLRISIWRWYRKIQAATNSAELDFATVELTTCSCIAFTVLSHDVTQETASLQWKSTHSCYNVLGTVTEMVFSAFGTLTIIRFYACKRIAIFGLFSNLLLYLSDLPKGKIPKLWRILVWRSTEAAVRSPTFGSKAVERLKKTDDIY